MVKKYLGLGGLFVFLNLVLVWASWQGFLPFASFSAAAAGGILLVGLAFFWPREFFWFWLVNLSLENVFFLGEEFSFSLRFFQVSAVALAIGASGKFFWEKRDCQKMRLVQEKSWKKSNKKIFSSAEASVYLWMLLFSLGGWFSSFDRENIKWTLIIFSFGFIFSLAGRFLRSNQEKAEGLFFFLTGSSVVWLVGFYQILAGFFGWETFAVMKERINATFAEPDWLGIYWAFVLGLLLGLKNFLFHWENGKKIFFGQTGLAIFSDRILKVKIFFIGLMLAATVSRSAWVGAAATLAVYVLWIWKDIFKGKLSLGEWLRGLKEGLAVAAVLLLAFFSVNILNFSNFDLFNRATSTLSGRQEITISCREEVVLPEKIDNLDQLAAWNCRHINLEEIDSQRAAGFFVSVIDRPDPNVSLRKEIYSRVWQAIKEKPWLGQGWGASARILGQDENGNGLNASNIFLEIWLSAGVLGLVAFLATLFLVGRKIWLWPDCLAPIFLLSGTAFLTANLFNAGIFSGFFWIWLAALIFSEKKND